MRSVSLLAICLAWAAPAGADEKGPSSWTVEDIVSGLQAREQAISSLDVIVKFTETTGPDYDAHYETLEAYKRALARFYKYKRGPRVPLNRTHTRPSAPQYRRIRQSRQGESRFDLFSGPPAEDFANVFSSECSRGRYWEQFWPDAPGIPRVCVRERPVSPRMLTAVALEAGELTEANPRRFSDLVREAAADDRLLEIRERTEPGRRLVQLALIALERRASLAQVYERLTLSLDPTRGLAPVEMESVWVLRQDDGYRDVPTPRGRRHEWHDLSEAAPGVWLARGVTVDLFASVAVPLPGKEFVPLVVKGKPVLVKGEDVPEIDLSQAVIKRYHYGIYRYGVERISVNQGVEGPLCPAVYDAGTIVQNYVSGEMYRLTQPGPAIDPVHKEDLGPLTPDP